MAVARPGAQNVAEKDRPMRTPLIIITLLGLSTGALAAPPTLGEGAGRLAGAPLALDPRLAARTCLPAGFRYEMAPQAVEARCPATGERILIPIRMEAEAAPRLKRGDSVKADFLGIGFRLSVGALAEGSPRDGQLMLRNSRSGSRFAARMDQSGRILVSDAPVSR
jgi:hypothetical protein